MWGVAGQVVLVLVACVGTARAQSQSSAPTTPAPPTAPTTTPQPTSAPASTATTSPTPATAASPPATQPSPAMQTSTTTPPTQGVYDTPWRQRSVDRTGLVVLGGIAAGDGYTMWRSDIIVPIHVDQAPALRVGVQLGYDHEAESIPELAAEAYVFTFFPTAYYDWKLPIRSRAGDFVASVEGGFGSLFARMKIDQPFMPGSFETLHTFALQLAAAFQFRARAGWIVSVQPIGFIAPIGDTKAPPGWNVHTETEYEFALLAGYQFP